MKTTNIETFNNLCEKLCEAKKAVRNHCVTMLKEVCDRNESKEINLAKMTNFLCDVGLGNPVFYYDGGNHPEYASNMYSVVKGFELKDGKLVFDIEDSDNYEVQRVSTDDLIELCDTIIEYEKDGYKLGIDEYKSEGMTASDYERMCL